MKRSPLAVARGDRFIVRYPSPAQTIGGGVIVEPHPARRWRRFQPDVIAALETRLKGTPAERLAQAAIGLEPIKYAALQQQSGLADGDFDRALQEAITSGLLVALAEDRYWAAASWQGLVERTRAELSAYHS